MLRRLHDADWSALEADLWQATCEVYEISYQCVRLDSTTSFGYHTITPDGLMQRGHSKDHRPDLPQLKLMAAAAQPTSHLLACDIVPGQSADDPLYLPLIRRVREQLRQHGLLYTGDCKMSALATRAELAAESWTRRPSFLSDRYLPAALCASNSVCARARVARRLATEVSAESR